MTAGSGIADRDTPVQTKRTRIIAELESSRDALIDVTAGLSSAQWHFKTEHFKGEQGRWSIAECAPHIALGEDSLEHFRASRAQTIEYVRATEGLQDLFLNLPILLLVRSMPMSACW